MKEKKDETMDRVSYDKALADFVTRLTHDLYGLEAIANDLDALGSYRSPLAPANKDCARRLRTLERRMLESAKRLPHANEYYYKRQDPQPGEDFGTDDRDHL